MKVINVGLCEGRHEIPGVTEFIFGNSINPTDFDAMFKTAMRWAAEHCDIRTDYAVPINGMEDCMSYTSDVRVNLYVTGLTAATAAVIKVCALNGIGLTLKHYDRESGQYIDQFMF